MRESVSLCSDSILQSVSRFIERLSAKRLHACKPRFTPPNLTDARKSVKLHHSLNCPCACAPRSRCQPHRKRESLHRLNGCRASRSRLHCPGWEHKNAIDCTREPPGKRFGLSPLSYVIVDKGAPIPLKTTQGIV